LRHYGILRANYNNHTSIVSLFVSPQEDEEPTLLNGWSYEFRDTYHFPNIPESY